MAKKPKKPKRAKLTSEERSKRAKDRAFKRAVRTALQSLGFTREASVADIEFTFMERTSDFDDAFIYENIIVLAEYTLADKSGTGNHFKNKAHIYRLIEDNQADFYDYLSIKFPDLMSRVSSFHRSEVIFRVIYFSKNEVLDEHHNLAPHVIRCQESAIKYFKSLGQTIHHSAISEFLSFCQIPVTEVAADGKFSDENSSRFLGLILPESKSVFPDGYKIISFYVSPEALISRSYVMRKDGWRDEDGLYQRMIDKKKVESIRKYLKNERRAFVNNVIVTLPSDSAITDPDGQEIDLDGLSKAEPILISFPKRANSIGLIDGQHRIFSYYIDKPDDTQIEELRTRQNLLATGIMYPATLPDEERLKFEAGIFLEINSTQNSAKSDLIQSILVVTRPYSPDSIGKRVIGNLARRSPLEDLVQFHFFETDRLKTTSIVSYALRPLVRLDGEESLFQKWTDDDKKAVLEGKHLAGLKRYVHYTAGEIAPFLSAAKANLPGKAWALRQKDGDGLLSVTFVNGLLILFRRVVARDGLATFETYRKKLTKLAKFDFGAYHSSQYNRMATDLLENVYGK